MWYYIFRRAKLGFAQYCGKVDPVFYSARKSGLSKGFKYLGSSIYMEALENPSFIHAYNRSNNKTDTSGVEHSGGTPKTKKAIDTIGIAYNIGRITDIRRLMLQIKPEHCGLFKRNMAILQTIDLGNILGVIMDNLTRCIRQMAMCSEPRRECLLEI